MPTFSNQATLSYSAGTVSSNIITGELISSISLIKTALTSSYAPGEVISYAVSIINNGASDFTGLSLNDDLGKYTLGTLEFTPLTYVENSAQLFINGQPQSAPAVTLDDGLVISGVDVPAGGSAMVIYSARANEYAPPCSGTIVNTVSLDEECICANASDSAEVESISEPRLSILKQMCPCAVSSCAEPVSFTFTISNTGCSPALANANVVITDTFDPPITISSVTFNGIAWTEGASYTYDDVTGEFATVAGLVTVPAATYTQNVQTGVWSSQPGESVLVISGTFCP